MVALQSLGASVEQILAIRDFLDCQGLLCF